MWGAPPVATAVVVATAAAKEKYKDDDKQDHKGSHFLLGSRRAAGVSRRDSSGAPPGMLQSSSERKRVREPVCARTAAAVCALGNTGTRGRPRRRVRIGRQGALLTSAGSRPDGPLGACARTRATSACASAWMVSRCARSRKLSAYSLYTSSVPDGRTANHPSSVIT